MKIFKKMKKGFTLVELVVVIAVIAILAAVSVGAYFGVTESANNSRLEQEAKQVYTAIQTVSLAPNEHSSLSKDGLVIIDDVAFETALEETLGKNVTLLESGDKAANEPTIYFVRKAVSPEISENVVYSSFDYHVAEINGKKAVADIVTGEVKVETSDVEAGEGSSTTTVPGATTDPITGNPTTVPSTSDTTQEPIAPDENLDTVTYDFTDENKYTQTSANTVGGTFYLDAQVSIEILPTDEEHSNGYGYFAKNEFRVYAGAYVTIKVDEAVNISYITLVAKTKENATFNIDEISFEGKTTINEFACEVEDKTSYVISSPSKQLLINSISLYGEGFTKEEKTFEEIVLPEPEIPVDPNPGEGTDSNQIVFELGENGSGFSEGTSATGTLEYKSNDYTLSLTNLVKVYSGARDALGYSCIKLGSSSAIGSFSFTVPNNINKISFEITGYKAKTTKYSVNGGSAKTIDSVNSSDNGTYETVEVDTSTNKTVSISTVSGGVRALINKIVYFIA